VGDKALVFWYDYRGRRVMTEHDEYREIYGSYAFLDVKWDFYVYDGWNIIEEIDITGNWELRAQYTWGLDLSHTLQGAGGIGGLLATHIPAEVCSTLSGEGAGSLDFGGTSSVVDGASQVATAAPRTKRTPLDLIAARKAALASSAAGESETLAGQSGGTQMQTLTTGADCDYWYLYDANGNVGQLLHYRPAEAVPVGLAAAYEYDPYGNTLRASDEDGSGIAAANKFRFSTKWLHDELTEAGQPAALDTTGLYYYGYRYYSPNLGRWISRDPIGEKGAVLLRSGYSNASSQLDYSGAERNLFEFVGNAPCDRADVLGLEECRRTIFPQVDVERFNGSILAHQWLRINGIRRGFYPVQGKDKPLVTAGGWQNEEGVMVWEHLVWNPLTGEFEMKSVSRLAWALQNDMVDRWNTRRRCTGNLQEGTGKGKECKCASDGEIASCLETITRPQEHATGTYCLIGGNCINHSEDALTACCLRKNQKTHTGKPFKLPDWLSGGNND
jgi:RHS repeat-associated protein